MAARPLDNQCDSTAIGSNAVKPPTTFRVPLTPVFIDMREPTSRSTRPRDVWYFPQDRNGSAGAQPLVWGYGANVARPVGPVLGRPHKARYSNVRRNAGASPLLAPKELSGPTPSALLAASGRSFRPRRCLNCVSASHCARTGEGERRTRHFPCDWRVRLPPRPYSRVMPSRVAFTGKILGRKQEDNRI